MFCDTFSFKNSNITGYCHGWFTFLASLFGIGFLTAAIGDVASHFGCSVGMRDVLTAISLVAMGTSLPGTLTNSCDNFQDTGEDGCASMDR